MTILSRSVNIFKLLRPSASKHVDSRVSVRSSTLATQSTEVWPSSATLCRKYSHYSNQDSNQHICRVCSKYMSRLRHRRLRGRPFVRGLVDSAYCPHAGRAAPKTHRCLIYIFIYGHSHEGCTLMLDFWRCDTKCLWMGNEGRSTPNRLRGAAKVYTAKELLMIFKILIRGGRYKIVKD